MQGHANRSRNSGQERSNGGKVKAANVRFGNRFRDALIRQLRAEGWIQQRIAQYLQCSQSTVSRVLSGVQGTCLTAAETARTVWNSKAIMRLLSLPVPSPRRSPGAKRLRLRILRKSDVLAYQSRECPEGCGFRVPAGADLCPYCGAEGPGRPDTVDYGGYGPADLERELAW